MLAVTEPKAEIKAAAERLRTFRGSDNCEPYTNSIQYDDDLKLIACAYLAEHPADDDVLVDEEWLMGCGFKVRESGTLTLSWTTREGTIAWSIDVWQGHLCEFWYCAIQRLGQECDRIAWPNSTSRSDVRNLCRALGVELDAE